MSALGERTLMQYLTDRDALETLAREGLLENVLPTEAFRPVYAFAIDYFFRSGRAKAPSVAALRADYGDVLDDGEIHLEEEPEDSIEWAIDDLKATYVHQRTSSLNKELAVAMSEAESVDRVEVLSEYAGKFVGLSVSLESRTESVDLREGLSDSIRAYEAREANRGLITGMRFGLDLMDTYTGGIRPGELAVLAAGPKTGKSYALAFSALSEWRAGRPPILFTLENSVEMTIDRIACMATKVDSSKWQRGTASPEEVEKVREFESKLRASDVPFHVVKPDIGKGSVEHMVREAQIREAESIYIDQLTFIELPSPRKQKTERIGEALHMLKRLISNGRQHLPCLMAHQISREGVRAIEKEGRPRMEHMAESAEVERTGDWVFGLFRTDDQRINEEMLIYTLAARREDLSHFSLSWSPYTDGMIATKGLIAA